MKEGLPGNQVVNRQFNNIVNDYNSMLVHCSDHGTQEDKVHLGEELSDVLIYLVQMAEGCHVDLPAAVTRN